LGISIIIIFIIIVFIIIIYWCALAQNSFAVIEDSLALSSDVVGNFSLNEFI
jgi:hypothetical protein